MQTGENAAVTGRVIFIPELCCAMLQDGDGTQLQAMLSLDQAGEEQLISGEPGGALYPSLSTEGYLLIEERCPLA